MDGEDGVDGEVLFFLSISFCLILVSTKNRQQWWFGHTSAKLNEIPKQWAYGVQRKPSWVSFVECEAETWQELIELLKWPT